MQKKDVSTINDSIYYESDEQVDTISESNKQVDTSSDPKEETHIINRIRKLSVRPISFELIVLSGDKLFREISTRKLSWTFVTRSCPMTLMMSGSKKIGLTDNLRILLIM